MYRAVAFPAPALCQPLIPRHYQGVSGIPPVIDDSPSGPASNIIKSRSK